MSLVLKQTRDAQTHIMRMFAYTRLLSTLGQHLANPRALLAWLVFCALRFLQSHPNIVLQLPLNYAQGNEIYLIKRVNCHMQIA